MAEAIAVIIDVGPFMSHSPPGGSSALECGIECLKMLVQRKLFAEKKDEMSVVLCGTDATDNDLADDDGNFEHITLLRPLSVLNWDLLETLNNGLSTTQVKADIIDGIIVGVDHLMNHTKGKKGIGSKRVVVVSNVAGEIDDSQIDDIIKQLRKADVDITLIGANVLDNDDDDDEEEEGGNYTKDKRDSRDHRNGGGGGASNSNNDDSLMKPKTDDQIKNEKIFKKILRAIDGESYTFEETIPAVSYFETRPVSARPWKVQLELADMSIPVAGYTKVRTAKPKSMTNVYARDPEAEIKRSTTYHKNDEAQTEVNSDDTIKGYAYGSTLVPFTEADLEGAKLEKEKCLSIIGFTKSENVPHHLYMSDGIMVITPDGESDVQKALSALIQAMHATNRVALVRRVYNKACNPRLGVLIPCTSSEGDVLEYTDISFAEDLRTFTFPALPVGASGIDEDPSLKRFRPSTDQLSIVDELIDNMLLHSLPEEEKEKKSVDTDDVEDDEFLKPSRVLNPYIQRLYQCVSHRAFNPGNPSLPEPLPALLNNLEPPRKVLTELEQNGTYTKLKKAFSLKRKEIKKKKITAQEMFKDDEEESPASKKARLSDESNDLSAGLGSILKAKATVVGSVDPVSDFEDLIANGENLKQVCEQMIRIIMQLVKDSYQGEFYQKAMQCLLTLRSTCAQRDHPEIYNQFIKDWRLELEKPASQKKDFWKTIAREKLGLIHREESSASDVTASDAMKYLESDLTSHSDSGVQQQNENIDDLLDEMD